MKTFLRFLARCWKKVKSIFTRGTTINTTVVPTQPLLLCAENPIELPQATVDAIFTSAQQLHSKAKSIARERLSSEGRLSRPKYQSKLKQMTELVIRELLQLSSPQVCAA